MKNMLLLLILPCLAGCCKYGCPPVNYYPDQISYMESLRIHEDSVGYLLQMEEDMKQGRLKKYRFDVEQYRREWKERHEVEQRLQKQKEEVSDIIRQSGN